MSRSVHGQLGENGSGLSHRLGKGKTELTLTSRTKFRASQSKIFGCPFYYVCVIDIRVKKCNSSLYLNAVIAEMWGSARNISSLKARENWTNCSF